MKDNKIKANFNLRYNVLIVIVYLIGAILLGRLFFLQIVKGQEYREMSNTRLTRESTIEAARGNILDRNGNTLATTKTGYSIELYKTKLDDETLNNTILKMIKLLEANGDTYANNFPIDTDYKFKSLSKEEITEWKKKYKIPEEATAKDCVYKFRDKYSISSSDMKEVLKIIAIRYEISIKGYSSTRSIKIAEDISKTSAIQFNEQNADFPGINIITQPIRTYTSGSLAAHIVGYIGKIGDEEYKKKKDEGYGASDYLGRAGVEYTLENYLRGENGKKQIDMSVDGTIEAEEVVQEAVSGKTIELTIDSKLQGKTETIIKNAVNKLKKSKKKSAFGAAVLMNVKSGEVLAMASYPTYTPESFVGGISSKDWKDLQSNNKLYSRATQGSYAPGSTFKMVTATAALESKVVKQTEYVNDRGIYPYAHHPVCWIYTSSHTGHGNVNIKQAIQKSCNFFFYEMGRRLGIDKLEKYAKFFGLGEKTGVELPETAGTLASKSTAKAKKRGWYLSDTLSAAIGQSYNSFSPLQMARYVSIVANGGKNVNATVVKSIKDTDGKETSREELREYMSKTLGINYEASKDVKVSQKNLDIVKAGMRLVTSAGGTAYAPFADFGKSVAGKTGSAQARATTDGSEIANGWFVGFTPYKNPDVAVVVILEDGAKDSYAAKIARKILDAYYGTDAKEKKVKEDTKAKAYTEKKRR